MGLKFPENSKHTKLATSMESSNTQMKISDIPPFCLEHIVMYLDLEDLLNIADANKCLRSAAQTSYARKYAGKLLIIDRYVGGLWKDTSNTQIRIENLKMIFQLLRCFGQMITELYMYYFEKRHSNEYHHVFSYVNEFCAESLTWVSFFPALHLEHVKRPFANVEEVIIRSNVYLQKCDFNICFPKLRRLRLPYDDDIIQCVAQVHFPNLHHLEFHVSAKNRSDAAVALRLNSQIKSLTVHCYDSSFLHDVRDHLQSLDCLEINGISDRCQSNCNSIHFQNVTKLIVRPCSLEKSPFPKLPLLFDQLKEFTLQGDVDISYYYRDFICENPTIEKLIFKNSRVSNMGYFLNIPLLEGALPSLKEIVFTPFGAYLQIEWLIIHYMEKFKSLSKFTFCLRPNSRSEIMSQYTNKYKVNLVVNNYGKTFATLERIEAPIY